MNDQTVRYKVQLTLSVEVEVPKPSEYTQNFLSRPSYVLTRDQKEGLLNYLGKPVLEEIAFAYQQINSLKQLGNYLDLTITEVEKLSEDE